MFFVARFFGPLEAHNHGQNVGSGTDEHPLW